MTLPPNLTPLSPWALAAIFLGLCAVVVPLVSGAVMATVKWTVFLLRLVGLL